MAKKKNQHWVPKFYLNAFAIPETKNQREPQVYALSKWERDKAEVVRVGTKNVATDSYLYSPVDEAGLRDFSFEDKLANLESMFATLWGFMADGNVPLVEGYRKALAMFVANLYLRHPRQRLLTRHTLEQFQNAVAAQLSVSEEFEAKMLVDGRVVTGRITREEFEETRARSDNDFHRYFVENVNDSTIEIATILMRKRWNVIVSPTADFITSDNPVCLDGPKDRPFDFRTPGVSITVPLTPERLLVIDDSSPRENAYVPICRMPGMVGQLEGPFNFGTFGNAYRFIYGPKTLEPVLYNNIQYCENLRSSDPNDQFYALRTPDGRRKRLSRNAPCRCGSGLKYKHCHLKLEKMLETDAAKLRNRTHERRDLEIQNNENDP